MKNIKTRLVLYAVLAIAALQLYYVARPVPKFHTQKEISDFNKNGGRAPIDSSEYFLGSITCRGCHGPDSAHYANLDENGNDVNLYDDWESTMMALSAKDPLWRAKVSHEILINPGHADELQTKCTSCHAPMGHYSAMFKGHEFYTIADLEQDTLGLNGVACLSCHMQGPDSIFGLNFSGDIAYDTSRVAYGPFTNPVIGPMELYTGLIPTYSNHMDRAEVCAPCHTLITKTADLSGNFTGATFVEQATFHEWVNSSFNNSQPCQSCHMPRIPDPVILANGYLGLPPRSPFNLHQFAGANVTMLKLIKENKLALGIEVADNKFDSTIALTIQKLQQQSVDMDVQVDSVTTDTLYASVKLQNKAGHKFPSGYPSRRAYVQFVLQSNVDTLFHSGNLTADYDVEGHDAVFEPHYNVINNPQQVQIYEMIMGDVNGDRTTVLERAADYLKDNRLPPVGFVTTHSVYDTVRIVGEALTDPDFNKTGAVQGNGSDVIHYHIPLNGFTGNVNVSAALYYQTLNPRWLAEMFNISSGPIDSFKNMWNGADKNPVLIAWADTNDIIIINGVDAPMQAGGVQVFPNPTSSGKVTISSFAGNNITRVEVIDLEGKKHLDLSFNSNPISVEALLPKQTGVYLIKVHCKGGNFVKKVLRQ
jgi:hypothetical protein